MSQRDEIRDFNRQVLQQGPSPPTAIAGRCGIGENTCSSPAIYRTRTGSQDKADAEAWLDREFTRIREWQDAEYSRIRSRNLRTRAHCNTKRAGFCLDTRCVAPAPVENASGNAGKAARRALREDLPASDIATARRRMENAWLSESGIGEAKYREVDRHLWFDHVNGVSLPPDRWSKHPIWTYWRNKRTSMLFEMTGNAYRTSDMASIEERQGLHLRAKRELDRCLAFTVNPFREWCTDSWNIPRSVNCSARLLYVSPPASCLRITSATMQSGTVAMWKTIPYAQPPRPLSEKVPDEIRLRTEKQMILERREDCRIRGRRIFLRESPRCAIRHEHTVRRMVSFASNQLCRVPVDHPGRRPNPGISARDALVHMGPEAFNGACPLSCPIADV